MTNSVPFDVQGTLSCGEKVQSVKWFSLVANPELNMTNLRQPHSQ